MTPKDRLLHPAAQKRTKGAAQQEPLAAAMCKALSPLVGSRWLKESPASSKCCAAAGVPTQAAKCKGRRGANKRLQQMTFQPIFRLGKESGFFLTVLGEDHPVRSLSMWNHLPLPSKACRNWYFGSKSLSLFHFCWHTSGLQHCPFQLSEDSLKAEWRMHQHFTSHLCQLQLNRP